MQREVLLLVEMIDDAEQAQSLVIGVDIEVLGNRPRQDVDVDDRPILVVLLNA